MNTHRKLSNLAMRDGLQVAGLAIAILSLNAVLIDTGINLFKEKEFLCYHHAKDSLCNAMIFKEVDSNPSIFRIRRQ